MPFLQNVTRGRGVPAERLAQVGAQYQLFGGVSPINSQNRELISALTAVLDSRKVTLPIYWANRNWHPLLADTVGELLDDGHRRILAIVTSAFGSYSGCRQYRDDLDTVVADHSESGLMIDKIRPYWNHPGFLDAMTDRLVQTLADADQPGEPRFVFTAHSIPESWTSTSPYLDQLEAAAREITDRVAPGRPYDLVFQSRSGPPQVPWLEPDISDHLEELASRGVTSVVVTPLGFISDHMEVAHDLDVVAARRARDAGVSMKRTPTAGTHPAFVDGLADLVQERLEGAPPVSVVGAAWTCPAGCCETPARPGSAGR